MACSLEAIGFGSVVFMQAALFPTTSLSGSAPPSLRGGLAPLVSLEPRQQGRHTQPVASCVLLVGEGGKWVLPG